MSKGEGQNLPVNRPVEANLLALPDDLIEYAVSVATPALERQALIEGSLTLDDGSLFVSDPPYEDIEDVKLRHIGEEKGWNSTRATVTYSRARSIGNIDPNTIWAGTEAEIKTKVKQRQQIEKDKTRVTQEHRLGEGALLMANEFGGIDVSDSELTARHLALRAVIIHKAQLSDVSEVVQAGLLDPTLAGLLGEDFATYIKAARTLVSGLMLLSDEQKETAGPAILQGVVVQAENFLENNAKIVETAAHVASDPEAAERALQVVKRGPNLTLSPEL